MPGKNDHAILATENLKALAYLCARIDDFPQWATTVAFYASLQAVEALFAHDGFDSDQHSDRNRRLKSDRRYQHIWRHYRPLWNDSLIARCMEDAAGAQHSPVFSRYMDGNAVRRTHIQHNLVQIIKSCRRLMNDAEFLKGCEPI